MLSPCCYIIFISYRSRPFEILLARPSCESTLTFDSNHVNHSSIPATMNEDQESDYGSELDYTDAVLLDRLDALPSSTNELHQINQQRVTQPEELPSLSREQTEAILIELQPQEKEVEEDKRSLWLVFCLFSLF